MSMICFDFLINFCATFIEEVEEALEASSSNIYAFVIMSIKSIIRLLYEYNHRPYGIIYRLIGLGHNIDTRVTLQKYEVCA